ncbi:carboxylesterase/lipase family protein [Dictyobacter arantiisoli]|uniref:Carboxylic ester hydrolase n=1 Tax=Dictyobacter arantiisoli TaxID=2014874 RepID=A0A5A5TDC9_9CHLR|nr:carboxylesterase/lipase family protein [Dictyobacter arantiisoli]GCF09541.1 carboxylesterase [Dictyobacter arantiisoli]
METVIVETTRGKIQGEQAGRIQIFKGIPFAQPPVGTQRFRAPQAPASWSGVRPALTFGPSPIQEDNPSLPRGPRSEDCLYLNVWTPRADAARRAVMVYVYGGSFVMGSGSQSLYNGSAFATHGDIVVVTLNYRLGALGFLYLGQLLGADFTTSGNNGLLDIIAALRWVRENIAAFGGDPEQVTLMGESAGAMSIATLLTMPEAQGLFARATMQSGASQTTRDMRSATLVTRRLLRHARLQPQDAHRLLTLPTEEISAAQNRMIAGVGAQRDFGPVVDGQSLPFYPLDAVKQGYAAYIPILIGTNHDESNLFATTGSQQELPDETLLYRVFGTNALAIQTAYARARLESATPKAAWEKTLTAYRYHIPSLQLAQAQAAQGSPVWMYRFDWNKNPFGAFHALELAFVWKTIRDNPDNMRDLRQSFPQLQSVTLEEEDVHLADQMHNAWSAFVRTGNPGISTLPAWPRYDGIQRYTMLFNTPCEVQALPECQPEAGFESRGFSWNA